MPTYPHYPQLRKNATKANSYIDKSPLAPLFQRGGINAFCADLVRRRTSPFEKGGSRGIFKIYNIMFLLTYSLIMGSAAYPGAQGYAGMTCYKTCVDTYAFEDWQSSYYRTVSASPLTVTFSAPIMR